MLNKIYKAMLERATPYLKRGRKYDYSHTKAIIPIAETIIKKDGLDEEIILPAIIFHDIGWSLVSNELRLEYYSHKARMAHMRMGAKLTKKLLGQFNYPKNKVNSICHLVRVHDYPSSGVNKSLKTKNELAVACIDFLWRLTKSGFWANTTTKSEATHKLATLKSHAKEKKLFYFSKAGTKIYKRLLADRAQDIKKKTYH